MSDQKCHETRILPNSRARIWPNLTRTNVRFAVAKTTFFFKQRPFYEHGSRSAGMFKQQLLSHALSCSVREAMPKSAWKTLRATSARVKRLLSRCREFPV